MPLPSPALIRLRSLIHWSRVVTTLCLVVWLLQPAEVQYVALPPPAQQGELPPSWMTDTALDATPAPPGGRIVTGSLLTGQKAAKGGKCNQEDQVPIGKGCWVELAKKPRAPPIRCGDYYEYNGRCFAPVLDGSVPTSIGD